MLYKFDILAGYFAKNWLKIFVAKLRKVRKMRLDKFYIYVDKKFFSTVQRIVRQLNLIHRKNTKKSRLCQLWNQIYRHTDFSQTCSCGSKLGI